MKYVVVAPYVTLKTMTPDGVRLVGFYQGAPVPADVPQEQIEHHLRDGMIEELPKPEPAKPAPAKAELAGTSAGVPTKSAGGGSGGKGG